MKKIIIMILISLFTAGCSFLPRVTFDKAGATPTSTDKSLKKESCAGTYTTDETGRIVSCTKGYKNYESDYSQKERAYTLQEKIANFIRGLAGWGFWIVVLLVILCPSAIGFIFGRIIEAVQGIGSKALRQVVKGVQNSKNNNIDLKTALESSTDDDVKKFIAKFKLENNIK